MKTLAASFAHLAAIGASTNIASTDFTPAVRQAMVDSLAHHVYHERMQAERCRDEVMHAWMLLGGGRGETRNVVVPMAPRKQEIGENHDRDSTAGNTSRERRGDRRFGKLHVRCLDDLTAGGRGELLHHIDQQRITFFPPRSVVYQNDANSRIALRQWDVGITHR